MRDVDRVLQVMAWFHKHSDHIFSIPTDQEEENAETEGRSEDEDDPSDSEYDEVGYNIAGVCVCVYYVIVI